MAYLVIEDFKMGLDGRRLQEATPAGALITLENAHINRGAEIEKAKKFSLSHALPNGTFGLASLKEALYTFGSTADPGVPAGITYQKLTHEAGAVPAMSRIVNWDVFAGKLFVIAEYANGDRRAFYNGVIVAGLLAGSGTVFAGLVLGDLCRTLKNKMYLCSGTNLLFSKIGDAAIFDETLTGSGLIDISLEVPEEANIVGGGRYQDKLAVMSRKNVSLWTVDPDPAAYEVGQVLENLSNVSAKSIRSFGDHDLFNLTDTGVRSLRAFNSSLAAGVSDVGTAIDDIVIAKMDSVSADTVSQAASAIEPRSGRYFLALGDLMYIFTYFSTSKISAWSVYNPGVNITDFAIVNKRVYARAGNSVYLLGGAANDEYTDQVVTIETPYLDGRSLGTWKEWEGFDIVCQGTWDIDINTDPTDPDVWEPIATLAHTSIEEAMSGVDAEAPMIKFRFTHQAAGRAVLSKLIAYYKKTGKEG